MFSKCFLNARENEKFSYDIKDISIFVVRKNEKISVNLFSIYSTDNLFYYYPLPKERFF